MLLANLLFPFVDISTKWLLGSGLAVIQLAFMRYLFILTRKPVADVTLATMQFHTGALGSALLLPVAFLFRQHPEGLLNWSLLMLVGAFARAGHEAMTRAHKFADASPPMPPGSRFLRGRGGNGLFVTNRKCGSVMKNRSAKGGWAELFARWF